VDPGIRSGTIHPAAPSDTKGGGGGSISNWSYGEFVWGFRLGKLLDGLGCNFVIVLDMHSGDLLPNLVRITLAVLCLIGIMGNLYGGSG
jgi:hypothetical protein